MKNIFNYSQMLWYSQTDLNKKFYSMMVSMAIKVTPSVRHFYDLFFLTLSKRERTVHFLLICRALEFLYFYLLKETPVTIPSFISIFVALEYFLIHKFDRPETFNLFDLKHLIRSN